MARGTPTGAVQVRGLSELQRALRDVDVALPRELRVANKEAAELVADAARARAEGLGGVAEKTAPSIRALGEQRRAKIALGGARYPFALGANFGAYHDRPRNTAHGRLEGWNQFPSWAGNRFTGGSRDRFLYWAVAHKRKEFIEVYEQLLDAVAKRAFPSGTTVRTV